MPEMPSSEFGSETSFMAQYMSSVSRAGVILNSPFPNLQPERDFQQLRSVSTLPRDSSPEHDKNSSSSVIEDSLEEVDESYKEAIVSTNTNDQVTALHLPIREIKSNYKEHDEWEDQRSSPYFRDDNDDLGEDLNDPLLKKLEQLKEIQQQKQEQLKRQQLDQLQKLREEQMMLLNLVPRQPAYSALEQYPPFGQLNSSTSINNQYMTSARNQNIYTDHLNGQDPFSTNAYEGERNMHSRKMCNTEMSHYIISKSAACIQGIYQDGPEEQNYVGNKDYSTNCVGENYTCVGKATEQSPPYDGCTKTIEENGKLQNGSHMEMVFTEDRPIVSEMKERKKSFEDFLEEQIRLEEQRASENQQECIKEQARHKAVVKKPFLRRGEGLARFRNANTKLIMPKESKIIPQIKVSGEWNTAKAEKPPLQRKTALVGNEQSCEIASGTIKRPVQNFKGKTETILSISQKPALKNVKMKISPPLATEMQLDNKYNVNIKSTLRLENSNILENIENVIATKPNKLNKSGAKNQTASPGHNGRSSTHVKQPELSFEASFQKRQVNWEKEKQKENFELDEFLLLEQAAEDLSFSSNSSFVQKLLDQNYQMDNSSSRLSSTPVKLMQQAKTVRGGVGDANRRQLDEMQRRKARAASQALPCVPAVVSEEPHGNSNDGIHSSSTIEGKLSNPTEQLISKDECLSEDAQNGTITSKHKDFESNLCNNEDDIYEGSKAPSKDMNISTNNRDCDLDLSDGEGYNESTLVDVKKNSLDEENPGSLSSNSSQVEFDDEQTWADLEEIDEKQDFAENQFAVKQFIPSDYTSRSPVSIPDITIKRKVATKKNDVLSNLGVIVGEQSPPPTSDLVMKLFPSLKPKQKPDFQFSNKSVPVQEDAGDIICSQRLREKLVELETEIERFKIENSSLARLREAQEKALENLKKEAADFEQQKAKELVLIEELKKKEIEKLQKERKVFEKYASAARAIPDKKEREEIQSLKQQVTDLQEELKRKEAKWSHNHGRLRNQIETLAKENADLREEIKFMEKVRLENWKKSEETESKKLVEGHGTQLRSESISPPDLSKKGQKHCTPQPEKSIKIIHRSNSSLKGKASRNTKQAPSDSQRTKVNQSESAEITSLLPEKNLMPIEQKNKMNLIKGSNDDVQGEICYSDGKIERILKNGCHVILFPNGTAKEVSADGKSTTVTFFNGDVKQVLADQRVIYYYADAQTVHTAYPDGLEILQFSNGQTEKHFPDGKKEITFPDQTIKNLYKDGREESIFPDGTIITVQLDGSKLIEFDNGQRELHTTEFKRREYPDGTVKTVYSNGQQETKYASGRIRVKDKDGNILMDTKV